MGVYLGDHLGAGPDRLGIVVDVLAKDGSPPSMIAWPTNGHHTAIARTYALLTDGSTVEVRAARPADAEAVRAMHAAMSPSNLYLRFFSLSPRSPQDEAARVSRAPGPDHAALLAWLGGRLVGVASYEAARQPGVAEVAFAVPDDMHGRGIATLLLEHLVSVARERGVRAFMASALAENRAMLAVFADAGLPVRRRVADGVVEVTSPAGSGNEIGRASCRERV